jgi:hypothetical protein
MKPAFQFAAGILALSMALQPLAAAASCGMASPASCPMGMSEMSPDCPIAQQMADAACMQDCCNHAVSRTAVPAVAPATRKVGNVMAATTATVALPEKLNQRAAIGSSASGSSSPPPYILNQVFRI